MSVFITHFSAEAFRYYFLRECPFPGDGNFSGSTAANFNQTSHRIQVNGPPEFRG